MKRFRDMTEPELRDTMNSAARAVAARLPEKSLFVLLSFDDPEVAQYVSNAARSDIIRAMRETADRLEAREDVTR